MKKESFILYANQYAALERLTDGQLGALFRAIYRWLNGDAVKAETLEPQLFVAYKFLTLQIEINNEKYLQSKQRREAGKKETQGKQNVNAVNNSSSALTHACVNVNENENVNGNENVNENENVSLFANKQTTTGETPADTDTKTEEKEEEIRNKCMTFMKYWNQCVKKSGTRMSQVRASRPCAWKPSAKSCGCSLPSRRRKPSTMPCAPRSATARRDCDRSPWTSTGS